MFKKLGKTGGRLALFLLIFQIGGQIHAKTWVSGSGDMFKGAVMRNAVLTRERDGSTAVRLADNEYTADSSTDLLMHFNTNPWGRLVHSYKGYSLYKFSYIVNKFTPFMGNACIKFLRPKDHLTLIPLPGSLLRESRDMGSFSIEFWLKPFSTFDNEMVFSKYGPFTLDSGKTLFGGLRCYFLNERITWSFNNFFRDMDGRYYSFKLKGNTKTLIKEWQHIAVSYDHFSGKLTKWVNGVEDHVIWATSSGRYGGTPLIPAFHKNLRVYPKIASTFRGNLDEFRISRTARPAFKINRYKSSRGMVLSRVFDMGAVRSSLNSVYWKGRFLSGSAVFLEYRISNSIFRQKFSRLPWVRAK